MLIGSARAIGWLTSSTPNSSSTGSPSTRIRTGSSNWSAPVTAYTSAWTASWAPADPVVVVVAVTERSTSMAPSAWTTPSTVPAGSQRPT